MVPLGAELPSLAVYKLLKPSAFVFRTAHRRDRLLADWRREVTRMGECLELSQSVLFLARIQ